MVGKRRQPLSRGYREIPQNGKSLAERRTVAAQKSSVTAIIPALNAAHLLPASLKALARSDYAIAETLVFDDGSSDATGDVAYGMGASVVRNSGSPLGPGEGRNRAAAQASGDLLLFVDSDVIVNADAVGLLVEAISDPKVVAAFGSYDDSPPHRGVASLYVNLRHHFIHQNGPIFASTFWAGLGLVRRRTFLEMGGFDGRYKRPSIEDIELGARLVEKGHLIRLVPEARGKHLKNWSLRQLWRTDIFDRAVPWARLIADGRHRGVDLNGNADERTSAGLAYLSLITFAVAFWKPAALLMTFAFSLTYLVHNRTFLRLLYKRMSWQGFIGAAALHWCYHIYASAIVACALAWRCLIGLTRRH